MTREQVQCDNCLNVITSPICEHCGYNNSYQFRQTNISDRIYNFVTDYSCYDDDVLVNALVEEYGIEPERILDIIENYVVDMHVTCYIIG